MRHIFLIIMGVVLLQGCSKQVEKDVNPTSPQMPFEVMLNGPLTNGGDVLEQFQNTPNGKHVVYLADETTNGDNELYISDSDGTNKRKLQGVPNGRDVIYFIISPDSTRVAFLMDLNNPGLYDLYTINIDGTGLTQMNQGVSGSRTVSKTFKFTPDSAKVVFATNEVANIRHLYISNAVAPVNRLQLNSNIRSPVSSVFEIANNGSRIVFKESNDPSHPNVLSVLPNATGEVQLNPVFTLPGSGVSDFTISPLSNKVVYRANQDNDAIYELYSVNTDGTGGTLKVNGSIVIGGSVQSLSFKVTSNGSKVVYIADQNVDEKFELYTSNMDGSANTKISGTIPASGDVSNFKITSDNLKVVFQSNLAISTVQEIYSVNINGSSLLKVNSTLVNGENVGEYHVRSSAEKVIYAMDKGSVGLYSIYSNDSTGGNEIKLNSNISTGIGFYDPAQSSLTGTRQIGFGYDGSRVVMVGSLQGSNQDIYSASLDGTIFKKVNSQSGGTIVLNSTADGSGFLTLPNAHYAVYRYNDGTKTQLYAGLIKE